MEDDNYLHKDRFGEFPAVLAWLKSHMDQWDVFNGNPTNVWEQNRDRIRVLDHGLKIIGYEFGKTTNFIIYNQSSYHRILELEGKYEDILKHSGSKIDYGSNAYDAMFCRLGLRHVTHIPYFSQQEPGFSDLENRTKDDRANMDLNMHRLAEYTGLHLPYTPIISLHHHRESRRKDSPHRGNQIRTTFGRPRNRVAINTGPRIYRVPRVTRRPRPGQK
jgi:hypothetical protein